VNPQPKIDEIDIKILEALLRDARCNFAEIAKNCNLSITAIAQRYKKMKKAGVITGTTLIANLENPRGNGTLVVDIIAEADCENAIIKALKKLPGVLNCCSVIGKYDIHAAIRVGSLEQIDNVSNALKKVKGVLKIELTGCTDKLDFYPENILKTSSE
jgi:DNA-binding Lrp family transcriptional regulator